MKQHLLQQKKMAVRLLFLPFICIFLLTLFAGCNRETLFKSNFNADPLNAPPSHTQSVGTLDIDGPAGNVKIIESPINSGGKWVQVIRTDGQQSVTGIKCNNAKFIGDGKYHFSAALFIPKGAGVVTVQFEPVGQPVGTLFNFLHIDFTQDNMIRIDDDDASKFGSWQNNSLFSLFVSLDINGTASKATISLAGANTSGSVEYTILAPFQNVSRQFGAVRLWMGFPWTGSFDATDILVQYDL